MAFPEDSLTDDEHVVLLLHPHWSTMIIPGFWTVVAVIALGGAALLGWAPFVLLTVGAIALVLFLWLAFWPFLIWRSRTFVFTNERVMLREGVLNRQQRDIPLERVNDVTSAQMLLQRIIGSGQLTVESAGERGQSVLRNIPRIVTVQKQVYELVEADKARRAVDEHDLRTAMEQASRHDPEHH